MMRTPNAIQKILHRFFVLKPVTAFFAPRVQGIDTLILRLTMGKYTGSEILGWPIIQLTSVGAKTARSHTVPLIGLLEDEKIGLVASSFGRKHNPAWYYNLKAHPQCAAQWRGSRRTYCAHEAEAEEYGRFWQLAVSVYEGYEKYKVRAGREIPIMVLEPKK
jgi:deazaflavin-dependent oxidoreductase (nitroreductase family)